MKPQFLFIAFSGFYWDSLYWRGGRGSFIKGERFINWVGFLADIRGGGGGGGRGGGIGG